MAKLHELLLRPASPFKLFEQGRIAGHTVKSLWHCVGAVIVCSDTNGVHTGNLAHVVKVVGYMMHADRRGFTLHTVDHPSATLF